MFDLTPINNFMDSNIENYYSVYYPWGMY